MSEQLRQTRCCLNDLIKRFCCTEGSIVEKGQIQIPFRAVNEIDMIDDLLFGVPEPNVFVQDVVFLCITMVGDLCGDSCVMTADYITACVAHGIPELVVLNMSYPRVY